MEVPLKKGEWAEEETGEWWIAGEERTVTAMGHARWDPLPTCLSTRLWHPPASFCPEKVYTQREETGAKTWMSCFFLFRFPSPMFIARSAATTNHCNSLPFSRWNHKFPHPYSDQEVSPVSLRRGEAQGSRLVRQASQPARMFPSLYLRLYLCVPFSTRKACDTDDQKEIH